MNRQPQIDLLKGFAILSVIILHSVPKQMLYTSFSLFHIYQGVPIFLILLGHNYGVYLSSQNSLYSRKYFIKQYHRLISPIIPIFIISSILAILNNKIYFGWDTFLGRLPLPGPGNYYISILIQFIIIFPFLFWIFNKFPILTMMMSFIISIALMHINMSSYIYMINIFRCFSAFILGLWIINNYNFTTSKNRFILLGFSISIFYLTWKHFESNSFDFIKTQNIISYFYPLVIIMLCMKLPSKGGWLYNFFIQIGKASYHIFLTQIIYFILIPIWPNTFSWITLLTNTFLCVFFGMLFFKTQKCLYVFLERKKIIT